MIPLNIGKVKEKEIKSFGPDFVVFSIEGAPHKLNKSSVINLNIGPGPQRSQDCNFWKEAINNDIEAIMCNKTWKLVDYPLVLKILRKKLKVSGSIEGWKHD